MNAKLAKQITQLREALSYAESIQKLDARIEAGIHVNFSKATRQEAVEKFISVMAEIVESATEHDFNKVESMPFDQKLMNEINKITNDYRVKNGITY